MVELCQKRYGQVLSSMMMGRLQCNYFWTSGHLDMHPFTNSTHMHYGAKWPEGVLKCACKFVVKSWPVRQESNRQRLSRVVKMRFLLRLRGTTGPSFQIGSLRHAAQISRAPADVTVWPPRGHCSVWGNIHGGLLQHECVSTVCTIGPGVVERDPSYWPQREPNFQRIESSRIETKAKPQSCQLL